jgi:hypothetical protein
MNGAYDHNHQARATRFFANRDDREACMKTRLACLLVVSAAVALPNLAHACGNGAVQLADDFKTPNDDWIFGDDVKISGGAITLLPAVNAATTAYNAAFILGDADICVQITLNDFTKPRQLSAGIVFRMLFPNETFGFDIFPTGGWHFKRLGGESWTVISRGNSDAIKKGVGDVNEVEIRLSGNTGTGYVNGTEVATFSQPEQAGRYFGIYGQSEDGRVNIWEFRDFKILKLQ